MSQRKERPGRTVPAVLIVLTALVGCAGVPTIPPVTTSAAAAPMPGKFVWYDLLTEDLPAVRTFYGELLGWTFEGTEAPNYTLVLHGGRPIGGIVDMTKVNPDVHESQWISTLSVADVDGAVETTRRAGGKVHVKPTDLPGRGRLAIVSDPAGAVVAFLRAPNGDPPDRKAGIGEWMWTELWTHDVDASSRFYGDLVGFELKDEVILDDIDYLVFKRNDVPRAGVIPNPFEEVRTHWLPYVRVEDPAALAKRAQELGGKLILAPSDDARKGSVAVVIDPSGAAVALQEWPDS